MNNLEGLGRSFSSLKDLSVAALMGPAGIAGMLTLVGTAAYTAFPYVRDLFGRIIDGANEVPRAKDSLERLRGEIEANKKQLEELSKHQSLTNTQLAEYNRLTDETAAKEREANKERERRNYLEKARKDLEKGDQEVAENVQAVMRELGGPDRVGNELMSQLAAQNPKTQKQLEQLDWAMHQWSARKGTKAQHDAIVEARRLVLEDRKNEAVDLMKRASEGDVGALTRMIGVTRDPEILERLLSATPEALRAGDQDVAEAEHFGERAHGAGERRRQAAREYRQRRDKMERNLDKATHEGVAELDAQEREKDQQARQDQQLQEMGQRMADQARKQREHDAQPENVLARQRQDLARKAIQAAQDLNRSRRLGLNPEQVAELANQAVDRLPFAGGDMRVAVQQTAFMLWQKMQQQMQAEARKLMNWNESFLGR